MGRPAPVRRESLTKPEKVLRLCSERRGSICGEDREGQGNGNEGEDSTIDWLKQVPHRGLKLGGVGEPFERGHGEVVDLNMCCEKEASR